MQNNFSDANTQISQFLSESNFLLLQSAMTFHQVTSGTHLFWDGEPSEHLYYVKSGQIHITKSTEEGKELILFIRQDGDLFGEIGSVGKPVHTFNAKVVQDSMIGFIPHEDLEQLIGQNGGFAVEFMRWMGLMHQATQAKFRDLLLYGKSGALASTLIRLAKTYGVPGDEGIDICIKLTNTDLANIIGTTREGVNRQLHEYMDNGILTLKDGRIVIRDLQRLKTIVNCANCPDEICRL
ncbi:Crp/Fnr family transcriptional regulator [Ferviditalea candida]|uniref:Crp/Fnr family transcriptional regulator n=1 Tax=Ferviditalea candida TaxID=3108399 RepID=A0ABU5ZMP2_9BACL|nr:Crp/Fnr family transcriptional regulator [Paenibacillaceae bacterium T2]